jgi:hypothetical protein
MHPEGGSGTSRCQDEEAVADQVPGLSAQGGGVDDKE